MIIVTGGAGFIGSNIVKALNDKGQTDILVVDDLTDGRKCKNLQALSFTDYIDHHDFEENLRKGIFPYENVEGIFHEGACSSTMVYDGQYMMRNNFESSKLLFHYAQEHMIPFIYASSASTYGGKTLFTETREAEEALNPYAFSKLVFDRYVLSRQKDWTSQVVGLRYFNVFGPQENHKDNMSSLVCQMYPKLVDTNTITLFGEYDGCGAGEQLRDFIYVKDVVNVNLFFFDHPELSGIYNCGTGKAHSFNEFMEALIKFHGSGQIEYIPFPEKLKGKYQSYTQANTDKLMAAGYDRGFTPLEEAVAEYATLLRDSEGFFK